MAVKRLISNIPNAMRDVLVVITEYERLSVTSMSDHPYTINPLTSTQLRKAERDVQMKAMRDWFYQNYDTLDELPYDSSEGGYQFIWGGPYDAREELEGEFSGVVPDDIIKELAEELDDISSEWSGRAYDDPDDYLFSFSPSDLTIYDTFQMNLHNIESLLSLKRPEI